MSRKPLLLVLLALALALSTLACGLQIHLPAADVKTGPTQTETIQVPAPSGDASELTLSFGAGKLNVTGGAAEGSLVDGTAVYNVNDLKPNIVTDGSMVRIETGDLEIRGFPSFKGNLKNEWSLKLGSSPIDLKIKAGAYQGDFELGGLSLRSLEVTDGAAEVNLRFSELNRVDMDSLRYETGASNVELTGLANANFQKMVFRSGAGDYTLDFSGDLKRDASVEIKSGVSQVTVVVPQGMNVQVSLNGGLTKVETEGEWQKSGSSYQAAGSGPTLTIQVDMGAGNLKLQNR